MASLLHLPVIGAFYTFDALDVDQVVDLLVELLEFSTQEAKNETFQCRGAYVHLAQLLDIYHNKCDARQWTLEAQAYLLHLVGCTLFANKSVTHISVIFLDEFRDLSQSLSYSQGVLALVYMYDNLNDVSKRIIRQLAGYIPLFYRYL